MSLFPPEIVESRREQYRDRSANLYRPERSAICRISLGVYELGYLAVFAGGIIVDTIKASTGGNPTLRP